MKIINLLGKLPRFTIAITYLACLSLSCNSSWNELLFSQNHEVKFFDIDQVKLLYGPFKDAQDRDKNYLLSLQPEKLLSRFRATAGLDSLVPAYKGWEAGELRGHFTGHYLSACAMMYAATGDEQLKRNIDQVIAGLKQCQDANKDGYISAFPESFIERAERKEKVWAPYYTLHKILAGLLDVNTYCKNDEALGIAKKMANWIVGRCNVLTHQQIQSMLDSTEQGGMNEVFYNLYAKTKEASYLELAKKFYQESYFDPLAKRIDSLEGQHSNSFIPNVVGIARAFEITGDTGAKAMATYFWDRITKAHAYITGGTSNDEHWGKPFQTDMELGPASHETCCSYNMLKLTRHLLAWDPRSEYGDYYEKVLWNAILPSQDPQTGMTMYYVPMASGYYKTFGTQETSFWCCTGTGVENFSKTANSIYFGKGDSLFINQFIASELNLPAEKFYLRQDTKFPTEDNTIISITTGQPRKATLLLRLPSWVREGYSVKVNEKEIPFDASNGYISIKRTWKSGDKISYLMPMKLKMEITKNDKNKATFMYGPVVLAAKLGKEGIIPKLEYGVYGPYNDKPIAVPVIKVSSKNLNGDLVKDGPLQFSALTTKGDLVHFIPFYELFHQRYMIYTLIN